MMYKHIITVREYAQTFLLTTEKVRIVKNYSILYQGTVEEMLKDDREEILDNIVNIVSAGDRVIILSCSRAKK